MKHPPKLSRVEARIPTKLLTSYRAHAEAIHGMKLATWIKMLMRQDFNKVRLPH